MRRSLVFIAVLVGLHAAAETRTIGRYPPVKFGDPSLAAVARSWGEYPMPITPAAPLRLINSGHREERVPSATAASPEPLASFAAVTGGVASPPDVAGAVGARHLMVAHNGIFQVQDRNGAVLSTMTDSAFWSTTGGRAFTDPRVIYDRNNARWIIVEANYESDRAGIELAVSQTDDPTGYWSIYGWPSQPNEWYDSPQLGSNDTSIVLSVLASSRDYKTQRREIYLFEKSALYAGSAAVSLVYGPQYSSLTPVTAVDRGVTTNYLIDGDSGTVQLYTATKDGVAAVATVTSPAPWVANAPVQAPQLGSLSLISTNDGRVASAVLRNGNLWFVQTCFLPADSPSRTAIQWWKTTTAGQVLDFGRIDDPARIHFYAFPSMAVNKQNDVAIGFSQFSGTAYASAAYALRSGNDGAGALRDVAVLKAGEGAYGLGRWGDYTTTVVDPDDTTFWTLQEYAAPSLGTAGRWGTWWAHLAAASTASSCTDGDTRLCLGNGRFAVGTRWITNDGTQGVGHAVRLTNETGYFWFFGPDNVEVVVKMLDGCVVNQSYWVFAAGLTNVHVFVDIGDSVTQTVKTYENPANTPFQPIQDTSAFPACR